MRSVLDFWFKSLTSSEKEMLLDYTNGLEFHDKKRPFSRIGTELGLYRTEGTSVQHLTTEHANIQIFLNHEQSVCPKVK